MLRIVLTTASLVAGLLMFDLAQPSFTGSGAEAAPRRAAPRPAPRRVVARPAPRPHVQRAKPAARFVARPKIYKRPNFVRKNVAPKIVRTKPVVIPKQPKMPVQTLKKINANPAQAHSNPNQPHINPLQQKGNPSLPPGPKLGKLKNGPHFGKQVAFVPAGPKGNFLKLANKSWPIHKGPHKLWWKGGWKVFVPFSAVSVALIGGAYYYPDAYVSVARPYCGGITPDGCQLNWQQVPFADGGSEWQCVQYCARPNQPPPARAAALVIAPPAPAAGRCELEIFGEPGFQGANAPSDTDQPRLVDAGWKNEISSVQVKSGTWDFFSDDDFNGENMRLPPGPYPQLGPQWTKKIGSFMCVQGN